MIGRRGRRTVTAIAAGALIAAFSLAGCGVAADAAPQRITARELAGAPTPEASPPSTTQPSGLGRVIDVFLIRDQRLVSVPRAVSRAEVPGPALDALLAGPTKAEAEHGVSTAIPTGSAPLDVTVVAGVAVVRVPAAFEHLTAPNQILVIAQLLFTLTEVDGIIGLQMTDGEGLVDVPNGSGELSYGPLYRADFSAIAPPGTTGATAPPPSGATATPTGSGTALPPT